MIIKSNEKDTELSYMELCGGLLDDIETDVGMTKNDKKKALYLLNSLYAVLEGYSG